MARTPLAWRSRRTWHVWTPYVEKPREPDCVRVMFPERLHKPVRAYWQRVRSQEVRQGHSTVDRVEQNQPVDGGDMGGKDLARGKLETDSRATGAGLGLSLIHISEPTRRTPISYAVFCLKKKK